MSASPRAVGVVGAAARWCWHGCACAGLIVRAASLPFVCVSASCPHAQRMEVHVRMHACACVCACTVCVFRGGTVGLVILPRKSDAVDSTLLSCVAGEARRHSGDPRDDDVVRQAFGPPRPFTMDIYQGPLGLTPGYSSSIRTLRSGPNTPSRLLGS